MREHILFYNPTAGQSVIGLYIIIYLWVGSSLNILFLI